MRKDEVIIKIATEIDMMCGNLVDLQSVRLMLERVLYDYDVNTKETALATRNNIQDMIMLFIASKHIEGLSNVTLKGYSRQLMKLAEEIQKNVEDITAMDLRIHLANYAKTGVKNSTIATRMDVLKSFFGWLRTEEYIIKDPTEKIKSIKVDKDVREPLTPEEFELLTNGAKTLRQKALLYTFASTGCRLSEVVGMDISDLDWDKMRIKVVGKGNKERFVYFNARAKIHLRKYLNSRTDEEDSLFVTTRAPIGRLGNRGIQREVKVIQLQSSLNKNVYPHLLRHGYSTTLLTRGADITSISKLLGHTSVATTEVYAKTSMDNVEHDYKRYMWS